MTLSGAWVPQNDVEDRLMEDIHIATRRANQDDMSRERIAALLSFMASAALDPASDAAEQQEGPTLAEQMEEEEDEVVECPNCGTPVGEVVTEMGGALHVEPCGCIFDWEDRDQFGQHTEDLDPREDDDGR